MYICIYDIKKVLKKKKLSVFHLINWYAYTNSVYIPENCHSRIQVIYANRKSINFESLLS